MAEIYEHTVKAGQRLDLLAHQYLGNPLLIHEIVKLNPSLLGLDNLLPGLGGLPQIRMPDTLPVGIKMDIPKKSPAEIRKSAPRALPPWKL